MAPIIFVCVPSPQKLILSAATGKSPVSDQLVPSYSYASFALGACPPASNPAVCVPAPPPPVPDAG